MTSHSAKMDFLDQHKDLQAISGWTGNGGHDDYDEHDDKGCGIDQRPVPATWDDSCLVDLDCHACCVFHVKQLIHFMFKTCEFFVVEIFNEK